MAAYAALVSLMNTMDQIQIHPRFSTCFNKNQLESLGGTVGVLLDFIESYNYGGRSRELEDLEAGIASAAHKAEDVIESHIVDLILAESTTKHLEGEIASVAHVAEDAIESQVVDQVLAGSTKKKGGLVFNLDEIPSGIGEIPTLQIISLYNCNVHCALSAVKILEEQESLGNDDLQVEVEFHILNKEKDRFRKMMDKGVFTSNNLHIKNSSL